MALEGRSHAKATLGLDRLAARPGASVVVCEGEKSADAAAKVFPNSVCVTSAGGSQAAAKADWIPLANRKALIWPDADEPGLKYAAEVAAILHGQQCEASIIDAMALARMAPDGGGEPVKGWDAANVVVEWPDLAALRKAAHGLVKRFEATPHDNTEAGDEIKRLAGLREVDYEKARKEAAAKLGIRAPVLDKLVAAERPRDSAPGQGRPLELPMPEPWPESMSRFGASTCSRLGFSHARRAWRSRRRKKDAARQPCLT